MKAYRIGKTQYNLDSVLKMNKKDFEKRYSKKNPNWEKHFEELKELKK